MRRPVGCARSRPAQQPSRGSPPKARYRGAIAGWEELDLPLPLLLTLVERKTFLSGAETEVGMSKPLELVERLGAKGLKRLVGT